MNSYLGIEKNCPPYLGVCHGNYKLFSQHSGVMWSRFPTSNLKGATSMCIASSNSPRRNLNFSRQSKSFSRGRGRQNQEKETPSSAEEGDPLSSKNGTSVSLSNNPRFHATAVPGQREKEIVELFRKVQAQLRERASLKKEKKTDPFPQAQGERGTVDSLLKLLRKHSVPQGKKSSGSEDYNVNHSERSNSFEEDPNFSFLETETFPSPDDPIPVTSRPASNFQRKSPIPRIKYQPVYSAENTATDALTESTGIRKNRTKKETGITEPDVEPIFFDEAEDEFDDELSSPSDLEEVEEEIIEQAEDEFDDEPSSPSDLEEVEEEIREQLSAESSDLSSLKLSELRELAKSRGMKRYSKLKKVDLVKLLGGDGI